MRFKIDEHLPVEIKELLTHHQHDAVTVPDEDMAGAVDPDVAQACQKEARALVTLDLDFSDIRAYPPEEYQGIIVFRPALQSITTLVRLTARIIPLLDQDHLSANSGSSRITRFGSERGAKAERV
jgi:predicted nuclease of predicted toxin-antitoxin system